MVHTTLLEISCQMAQIFILFNVFLFFSPAKGPFEMEDFLLSAKYPVSSTLI